MTDGTTTDERHATALRQLNDALDAAQFGVSANIAGGELSLVGSVGSDEDRDAALDLATAVAERLGLTVDESIEILAVGPESAFEDDDRAGAGFGYVTADKDGDGELDEGLEIEADFADDPGTTDTIDVTEEDGTYFPPTDPVIGVTNDTDGVEVLGGFGETSMDDPGLGDQGRTATDDELAELVLRELREDALTTDLRIRVAARGRTVVLRGEVETLQDAENAEAVANQVPSVIEVREELTVLALRGES